MNEVQTFTHPDLGNVRTVSVDDEPYFVGKDVAEALGYSNASKAVSVHVDAEDKKLVMLDVADSQNGNVVKTQTAIINESGLYSLILSSKLPSAKAFKHWVTAEVLPSIRKTGSYKKQDSYTIEDSIERAKRWIEEQQEKRQLELTVAKQNELLDRAKPLVCFANSVKVSENSIHIGSLAKILKQNGVDIGQKRLFEWMRANGYLMKSKGGYNLPTQRSMELGLFEIKEIPVHKNDKVEVSFTTKVTGKGQLYFVNKFIGKKEELS